MLKILSKLIAPVYNTIGNSVTTKETIKNRATNVLVVLSNRCSRNWGMVVSPIFKYFGTK